MEAIRKEPQQLTAAVHRLLATHLDRRVFPEGLVFSEAQIARALEVSRTPVRGALDQLVSEGRIVAHSGRGFLVSYGDPSPEPVRMSLAEAGMEFSASDRESFGFSGAAERIYPDVEKTVSSCAAFGHFHLNQTAMASYYGISRTVTLVVLNQLESVGLVHQDRHARWHVERLTAHKAAEHYHIRRLLEPEALRMAAPLVDPAFLQECWQRIVTAMQSGMDADFDLIDQIERDLHYDIVHRCPNVQLVKIINESQLPLISTSYTNERYHDVVVTKGTLPQHLNVINSLIEGNVERAAEALAYHLEEATKVNTVRLEKLPPLSADRYPPYLSPA